MPDDQARPVDSDAEIARQKRDLLDRLRQLRADAARLDMPRFVHAIDVAGQVYVWEIAEQSVGQ